MDRGLAVVMSILMVVEIVVGKNLKDGMMEVPEESMEMDIAVIH